MPTVQGTPLLKSKIGVLLNHMASLIGNYVRHESDVRGIVIPRRFQLLDAFVKFFRSLLADTKNGWELVLIEIINKSYRIFIDNKTIKPTVQSLRVSQIIREDISVLSNAIASTYILFPPLLVYDYDKPPTVEPEEEESENPSEPKTPFSINFSDTKYNAIVNSISNLSNIFFPEAKTPDPNKDLKNKILETHFQTRILAGFSQIVLSYPPEKLLASLSDNVKSLWLKQAVAPIPVLKLIKQFEIILLEKWDDYYSSVLETQLGRSEETVLLEQLGELLGPYPKSWLMKAVDKVEGELNNEQITKIKEWWEQNLPEMIDNLPEEHNDSVTQIVELKFGVNDFSLDSILNEISELEYWCQIFYSRNFFLQLMKTPEILLQNIFHDQKYEGPIKKREDAKILIKLILLTVRREEEENKTKIREIITSFLKNNLEMEYIYAFLDMCEGQLLKFTVEPQNYIYLSKNDKDALTNPTISVICWLIALLLQIEGLPTKRINRICSSLAAGIRSPLRPVKQELVTLCSELIFSLPKDSIQYLFSRINSDTLKQECIKDIQNKFEVKLHKQNMGERNINSIDDDESLLSEFNAKLRLITNLEVVNSQTFGEDFLGLYPRLVISKKKDGYLATWDHVGDYLYKLQMRILKNGENVLEKLKDKEWIDVFETNNESSFLIKDIQPGAHYEVKLSLYAKDNNLKPLMSDSLVITTDAELIKVRLEHPDDATNFSEANNTFTNAKAKWKAFFLESIDTSSGCSYFWEATVTHDKDTKPDKQLLYIGLVDVKKKGQATTSSSYVVDDYRIWPDASCKKVSIGVMIDTEYGWMSLYFKVGDETWNDLKQVDILGLTSKKGIVVPVIHVRNGITVVVHPEGIKTVNYFNKWLAYDGMKEIFKIWHWYLTNKNDRKPNLSPVISLMYKVYRNQFLPDRPTKHLVVGDLELEFREKPIDADVSSHSSDITNTFVGGDYLLYVPETVPNSLKPENKLVIELKKKDEKPKEDDDKGKERETNGEEKAKEPEGSKPETEGDKKPETEGDKKAETDDKTPEKAKETEGSKPETEGSKPETEGDKKPETEGDKKDETEKEEEKKELDVDVYEDITTLSEVNNGEPLKNPGKLPEFNDLTHFEGSDKCLASVYFVLGYHQHRLWWRKDTEKYGSIVPEKTQILNHTRKAHPTESKVYIALYESVYSNTFEKLFPKIMTEDLPLMFEASEKEKKTELFKAYSDRILVLYEAMTRFGKDRPSLPQVTNAMQNRIRVIISQFYEEHIIPFLKPAAHSQVNDTRENFVEFVKNATSPVALTLDSEILELFNSHPLHYKLPLEEFEKIASSTSELKHCVPAAVARASIIQFINKSIRHSILRPQYLLMDPDLTKLIFTSTKLKEIRYLLTAGCSHPKTGSISLQMQYYQYEDPSSQHQCMFLQAKEQFEAQVDSAKDVVDMVISSGNYAISVKFANTPSAGVGVYRELISNIGMELCEKELPVVEGNSLFIKTANAEAGVSTLQNAVVPNPKLINHAKAKEMYSFLGMLMGIVLITETVIPIEFPSFFWKYLVNEKLTLKDLAAVDIVISKFLKKLIDVPEDKYKPTCYFVFPDKYDEEDAESLNWAGEKELIPQGSTTLVSWDRRLEFVDKVINTYFEKYKPQVEEVRNGFIDSLRNPKFCSYFYGEELSKLIAGVHTFEASHLEILKKNCIYDDLAATDSEVMYLWQILEEMTPKQRSQFLKFAWGRPRLPVSGTPQMKISSYHVDSGKPDDYLPVAHSCFFQIRIPKYSTYEIAKKKIIYAVEACQDMANL